MHTHTHTHTHRERERERGGGGEEEIGEQRIRKEKKKRRFFLIKVYVGRERWKRRSARGGNKQKKIESERSDIGKRENLKESEVGKISLGVVKHTPSDTTD